MAADERKKRTSHRGDAPVVNRKLRLLYVMDYLRTYSDENHPVKLKDIAEAMTAKNIYTTRKALYDDFAALEEYGFEVIRADNTYTYFYGNPLFEFAELKLLMDIIYASSFVSEKKSQALIDKLKTFCSTYQRGQLSRQMLTVGVKSKNESVLYSVDSISEAIMNDKQISFKYVDFATPDGNKHYRHDGEAYIRSPFHMIYTDNQYYLLCYNAEKKRMEHLRIDRILTGQSFCAHPSFSLLGFVGFNDIVWEVVPRFEKSLVFRSSNLTGLLQKELAATDSRSLVINLVTGLLHSECFLSCGSAHFSIAPRDGYILHIFCPYKRSIMYQ